MNTIRAIVVSVSFVVGVAFGLVLDAMLPPLYAQPARDPATLSQATVTSQMWRTPPLSEWKFIAPYSPVITLTTAHKLVISEQADGDTLVCWKGSCKRLNEVWMLDTMPVIGTPGDSRVQTWNARTSAWDCK